MSVTFAELTRQWEEVWIEAFLEEAYKASDCHLPIGSLAINKGILRMLAKDKPLSRKQFKALTTHARGVPRVQS